MRNRGRAGSSRAAPARATGRSSRFCRGAFPAWRIWGGGVRRFRGVPARVGRAARRDRRGRAGIGRRLSRGPAAPGAFAQSVFATAPKQRSSPIGLAASSSISRRMRSDCRTDRLLPVLRRRWLLPIRPSAARASGRPTQYYERRLSLCGNVARSPPGPATKECWRWSSRSFGCPPQTRPTASRARKPSANCARRCRCRARCGTGAALIARGNRSKAGQYRSTSWIDTMRPSRPRPVLRSRRRRRLGGARHLRTTFYNAIKGLRYGEERPREAGTRLEPRTAPMQRNSCPASLLDHITGDTSAGVSSPQPISRKRTTSLMKPTPYGCSSSVGHRSPCHPGTIRPWSRSIRPPAWW